MEIKGIERDTVESCFLRNLKFDVDEKKMRIHFKYGGMQGLVSEISNDIVRNLLSDEERLAVERVIKIWLCLSLNQVFLTDFEEGDIDFEF